MSIDIKEISYIVKEVILPLITLVLITMTFYIAWKKGIFDIRSEKRDKNDGIVEMLNSNNKSIRLTPSVMQTLAYDENRFSEYHQQSINQSRISFWFSLVFAATGFLIIATSIFTYTDKTGYIGIIAGTIIDAVSALFFIQSNKARQLMSDFFDKLRQDKKLEESLKLCASIDNEFMRNALRIKLSLYFSGLEDSYNIASEIIRIEKGERSSDSDKRSGE